MKFISGLIWCLFLGTPSLPLFAAQPSAGSPKAVVLGTNVPSAYSADYNARILGGSIEHIDCIFERMQHPHQVVAMPWRRAHQEVKKQSIDGFFTTILLTGADDHGSLSDPLALENWYWFWRADTPEPKSWGQGHKFGAILGSSQALWLKQENYPAPMTANNLPQLLKLLFSGRIDVILADKEHYEKAAADLGIVSDQYRFRFYRYMPLGAYFGRTFTQAQPEFLSRFNRHIYFCAPEGFQVSEYEREVIKGLILPRIHEWQRDPNLIQAIVAQNNLLKSRPVAELLRIDEQWQAEFNNGDTEFAHALVDNSLSQILRHFKTQSSGLITELIVTDARGFNVGISAMTSDFWQGDEEKYLQIINRPADTLFFDAVLFDESTRRFQVQLSLQIYQPGNPRAIGVMTVGVDIEKALSLSD